MVQPDKCSGCDLCGMYCPDFAIHGTRTDKPKNAAAEKETDDAS
jgi:2-oxoglutarate ferredoxin oxidoreductase subunit delta